MSVVFGGDLNVTDVGKQWNVWTGVKALAKYVITQVGNCKNLRKVLVKCSFCSVQSQNNNIYIESNIYPCTHVP